MFPHGQKQWDEYAAALNARMALLQIHVETDWLFALCSRCGWSLESKPDARGSFRYTVATHACVAPAPVPVLVSAERLF